MPSLVASPAARLKGRLRAPADKSISQRALILAALSIGTSRLRNVLPSADVRATAGALERLGVELVPAQGANGADWQVTGLGVGGLREPEAVLDFGNSGTGARRMLGVLATHPFVASFTGDASLVRRPMGRVLRPLAGFGAQALAREGGFLPLTLAGAAEPVPIRHRLEVASAQVKSALMLAGLNAPGETVIIEPVATRDHTERMLPCFGGRLAVHPAADGGRAIHVVGEQELEAAEVEIPGDASSAAFLVAAALIVPGSEVVVERVGVNPQRMGFFTCLQEMGADIGFERQAVQDGEPVADIHARCGAEVALRGIAVPAERAASMIDEYPILAVVAGFAEGETRMDGLAELRVKESDRLAAIAGLLQANGVAVEAGADSLVVQGGRPEGGGRVAVAGDHRIAMAALILGLGTRKAVAIDDDAMIATSFPGFAAAVGALGGAIEAA